MLTESQLNRLATVFLGKLTKNESELTAHSLMQSQIPMHSHCTALAPEFHGHTFTGEVAVVRGAGVAARARADVTGRRRASRSQSCY